jgi:hypothetical protein
MRRGYASEPSVCQFGLFVFWDNILDVESPG